jgi:hypothetical protein
MEKTTGSLYDYTFPRRLFWSRWQPKLNKLRQHLSFDPVRELSDTPHKPIFCRIDPMALPLEIFWSTLFQLLDTYLLDIWQNMWFIHNGPLGHFSYTVRNFLGDYLHWAIALKTRTSIMAKSFTRPEYPRFYSLWGHLKNLVHKRYQ